MSNVGVEVNYKARSYI